MSTIDELPEAFGGDLPVLTAVTDPSLEAELVAAFGAGATGISVVRRCVDVVELLAAASVRSARAALVSADLRGLDRAAVGQLAAYGIATVGLARDEAGERLAHQLGAAAAVPVTASPQQIAGALRAAALQRTTESPSGPAFDGSRPALNGSSRATAAPEAHASSGEEGVVIAVWGPTGAPGRSTLALGLADALAGLTLNAAPQPSSGVLLIDADPYGGSLAQLAGVLDEAPGLPAACRAGNAGTLDAARLDACCRVLAPGLRLLSGLDDAQRWPELRPTALEQVLRLARRSAAVTVVDCGFCLDDLSPFADGAAARRNAATLTCLREADRVLVVGGAEPVGLTRLVRDLPLLAEVRGAPIEALTDDQHVAIVVNRLRAGLAPGDPRRGVEQALAHHAGVRLLTGVPLDQVAVDRAHGHGRLLSEAAPDSALAVSLNLLARELTRWFALQRLPLPPGRRRRRGRRGLRTGTAA